VDRTFAILQSVLMKNDLTFVLCVNLPSGRLYGDSLAKQEQTTADYLATTPDALRPAVFHFTVFLLLIAFATRIMTFWYLKSIGDAFHFCFGSLCFADFSLVIDSQVLTHFLSAVFPTD
jgi:hypothetical protein